MAQDAGARPLYNISELSGAGSGDTLMVIGPTVNYTPEESSQVAGFIGRGGTLAVMDDFGTANSLLSGIGSPVTIDPAPVCQYDHYYVNRSFPVITDVAATPYMANVSSLVLNHPAVLSVSGKAQVIASTSGDAWLDYNGNAALDANERAGVYPVAATYSLGKGMLVAVSDSDVFINGMLDKGSNAALLKDLSGGSVMVDVSHGNAVTPLGRLYYTLKYDVLAQLMAVLLILIACIAYVGRDVFLPKLVTPIKKLILIKSSVKEKDNNERERKL